MTLAFLVLVEAALFVVTMVLANIERTRVPGEYAGTGFHLLLLPVIVGVPAALAGQASGFLWVACDVIASTGLIWASRDASGTGTPIYNAVRMAGHLFAGVWIAAVSWRLGGAGLAVGWALAAGFAIYTLAAGRLPAKVLALPGLLMAAWLLLLARHAQAAGL